MYMYVYVCIRKHMFKARHLQDVSTVFLSVSKARLPGSVYVYAYMYVYVCIRTHMLGEASQDVYCLLFGVCPALRMYVCPCMYVCVTYV